MNIRATAYHEAGHAVVAIATGVGIRKKGVGIVGDTRSSGQCHTRFVLGLRPDAETTGRSRLLAEKRICTSLAGIAAQRKFGPLSVRRYHASADYKGAVSLLSNFVGSQKELETYIRLLEIRTEQIVNNYWPEIVAMANEILKRKRLTGPEAMDVFYQAVRSNVERRTHERNPRTGSQQR
jgi:hypothetical protein